MIVTVQFGNTTIMLANVYGETGGHGSGDAAMITDDIISIIVDEMELHPCFPSMIVGDLNAETEDIPTITPLLEDRGSHFQIFPRFFSSLTGVLLSERRSPRSSLVGGQTCVATRRSEQL